MELTHLYDIGLAERVSCRRIGSDIQNVAHERKVATALSPAYAGLLNTPASKDMGNIAMGEDVSPCWALLLDTACKRQDPGVGAMMLPEEWLGANATSAPVPLASMLAVLKGLGRVGHIRLEKDGASAFLEAHKRGFELLPNGIGLMSSLLLEGTSSDPCRVHAALGVLCILVEHCFHCLWDSLAIQGEPRPALLRDLVLDSRVDEMLPAGLGVCAKVLFLPAGLNLRNLLLHGFLAPDELPFEFFSAVLLVLTSIVDCAIAHSVGSPLESVTASNSQSLHLPPLIDDISHEWLSLDPSVDTWLFSSSSFLPSGYDDLARWGVAEIRSGRSLLGSAILLPVLEHSLRVEFCSANLAPEYGIAQHGSYYSTLDGFGQRSKHQLLLGSSVECNSQPNLLLPLLGLGLVHILSDLFLQEAGPNIRACIVHGKIHNFGDIYNAWPITRPLNAVLLVFLLLCARRLPHDAEACKMESARAVLATAEVFISSYRPAFHPNAILGKSFAKCVLSLEQFALSLASRLPLFVEAPDSGSRRFVQPGCKNQIKFECEAAALSESKGSIRALAGPVRKELAKFRLFASADIAFSSLISLLPMDLAVPASDVAQSSAAAVTRSVSTWLLESHWHKRLLLPDFASLSQSVPFYPLILGLLDAVQVLADALAHRIEALESLIVDRKAKTRQRRQYVATLLSGPAFVEYLMAVILALEYHICRTLDKEMGISEEALARVANVTISMAGMGDDDDNRRGYDSGLIEVAGFLRTKSARIAFLENP